MKVIESRTAPLKLIRHTLDSLNIIFKWDVSHNPSGSDKSVIYHFEANGGLTALSTLAAGHENFEVYSQTTELMNKYFTSATEEEDVNYLF
jgi:hypothetical protein